MSAAAFEVRAPQPARRRPGAFVVATRRIVAFAQSTFREAMRNKMLYTILFFACGLIGFTWAIGQLALNQEVRVAKDLGLAGILLFGVVLSIVSGVNLVYAEIERKTVYAIIPKPIDRYHFVLGKYAGLALTLFVQMAFMSLVLCATLYALDDARPQAIDGPLLRALALLYAEVLLVTAIAVLFSTFSTPILSGLYTAGITLAGHFTPDLRALIAARLVDRPRLAHGLSLATQLVPDLHLFFVSGSVIDGKHVSVHGTYVSWAYVGLTSGYGLLFAGCVLALAIIVFARRDFV